MRPLAIELENFCWYAKTRVDLRAINFAAVVGANGAGKSSLIDGITWALYGEASKGTGAGPYIRKVNGELQYPLRVALEFELHGCTYLVVRQQTRSKAFLDLYTKGPGGQWIGLSASHKRDTQEEILRLLRLDYKTFTASALMLQGRSDTFTGNMTDGERMQVLQSILGLDRYKALLEAAKSKATALAATADSLAEQAASLRNRAMDKRTMEVNLEAHREAEEQTRLAVEAAEAVVRELEAKAAHRKLLEKRVADLEAARNRENATLERLAQERLHLASEVQRLEAAIKRPQELEAEVPAAQQAVADAEAEAAAADAEVAALAEKAAASSAADTRLSEAQQEYARLVLAQQNRQQRVATLRAQVRSADVVIAEAEQIRECAAKLPEIEAELDALELARAELTSAEATLREVTAACAAWEQVRQARLNQTRQRLEAARRQAALLGLVPCNGTDMQAGCRLLADAIEHARLVDNLRGEVAAIEAEVYPDSEVLEAARRTHAAAVAKWDSERYDSLKLLARRYRTYADKLPHLEAAEERRRQAVADLETLKQEAEVDEARLRELQEEVLPRLRAEVEAAQRVRADLERAKQRQAVAGAKARTLQRSLSGLLGQLEAARQAAEEAAARLPEVQQRLRDLAVEEARAAAEIATLTEQHAQAMRDLQATAGVDMQVVLAQDELRAKRKRLEEITAAIGGLKVRIEELERAAADAERLEAEAKAARDQAAVYGVLVEAYGGRRNVASVQKLIVEAAVPQIERLANAFLERLAAGRLQVRLDTTAEKASTGGDKEVLRITVLDHGTARDYRTFSGAERFMVDMGLRVALARFLAHRAGAEVDLFVMDEGLGALTPDNREAVVAALEEVAREFGTVLVITHIEEVRDRLPQRIVIERANTGSRVTVMA